MSKRDKDGQLSEQQMKDDLQAARERWREQETVKTEAFQRENFNFVAGSPRRYVGFKFVSDGVEVITAEWTLVLSTTKMKIEEVQGLITTLQENQK